MRRSTPPPGARLRTATRPLTREDMRDETSLATVRGVLLDELDAWADRCGYARHQTREQITATGMTLTAQMIPRTDGEWPSVHQAILEDANDRRRLRTLGTSEDAF